MDYLKVETELHPHLTQLGGSRKTPGIKVTNLCHVLIAIDKFYKDFIACDNVDMDACHILLRRLWQHNVDATHRGKNNIYVFSWEGQRVSMRSIPLVPMPTKEEVPKFIYNRGESSVDSKEIKQGFALLLKE